MFNFFLLLTTVFCLHQKQSSETTKQAFDVGSGDKKTTSSIRSNETKIINTAAKQPAKQVPLAEMSLVDQILAEQAPLLVTRNLINFNMTYF